MQLRYCLLTAVLLPLLATPAPAAVLYVSPSSTKPTPPYTNWLTSATSIQDAVDAASPGDQVLVTNGVYATGGRIINNGGVTRVAVTKPITVQSVNGATASLITGSGVGRCAYVTNNALLVGFTLTGGLESQGGGAYCETNGVVSNCYFTANSAEHGGGGYGGTYCNCTFVSNTAPRWAGSGGGAQSGTLNNCTLQRNSSGEYGGGVYQCVVNNSLLFGNFTIKDVSTTCGGGAYQSTLSNCVISGNWAWYGGGAYYCSLDHCTLSLNKAILAGGAIGGSLSSCAVIGNIATNQGGGTVGATLNNCSLIGNYSDAGGGGAFQGTLNNCLVVSNSWDGTEYANLTNCTVVGNGFPGMPWPSGSYGGTLDNCIMYFNTSTASPNYDSSSVVNYCCTTPLPASGTGNFTAAPLFVDMAGGNFRLQTSSPCINAGNNAVVPGNTDADGRPRLVGGRVDVGAYEYQPGVDATFLAWLQRYGLATDGSADFADSDGDSLSNWAEWVAGTDPTNAASALRLQRPVQLATNVTLTWSSVTSRSYAVEQAGGIGTSSAFSLLRSNISGRAGTTSFTHTNAAISQKGFYRVRVEQ